MVKVDKFARMLSLEMMTGKLSKEGWGFHALLFLLISCSKQALLTGQRASPFPLEKARNIFLCVCSLHRTCDWYFTRQEYLAKARCACNSCSVQPPVRELCLRTCDFHQLKQLSRKFGSCLTSKKKAPSFDGAFFLVAGAGLEPATLWLWATRAATALPRSKA